MAGCQRFLVCGWRLCSETEIITSSNYHIIIFLYIISLLLFRYLCVIQYVASKIDFSFFLNNTSDGSCRNC